MAIALGNRKSIFFKRETGWGVIAPPGATFAKTARRVTGNFNLKKDTYQSEEIRADYQMADFRHGVRKVEGQLSGELSPGSYADFLSSALARDFTAGINSTALTNVTAASTGVGTGTFTRAAGSYVTDGFKVGDVVRWTGWAAPATANNAHNMMITALTATVMTVFTLDPTNVVAKAAGDSVTATVFGKKTYAPLTGHTDDSYTVEEWNSQIAQSEVFTGNKVTSAAIDLPPTGLAKLDLSFMGKDMAQSGTVQYFTTPSAASASGVVAAVNGVLLVNGVIQATITGLKFTINRNSAADPVVGQNVLPDIFKGRILVDGEFSAYFENGVLRDLFTNETETSIAVALTTNNLPNADFISFTIPRVKVGSSDKDDGEKGIVRTYSFQALLNAAGGAGTTSEATTISIQDSLA